MKISVTQEEIDRAIPHRMGQCMVALAAQRAGLEGALVFNTRSKEPCVICVDQRRYPVPVWVRDLIRIFDAGGVVEPFEFEIVT